MEQQGQIEPLFDPHTSFDPGSMKDKSGLDFHPTSQQVSSQS